MTPATLTSSSAHVDFRQLRHQTKNALTRILAQVSNCLPASGPTQRIASELERRIMLTAEISDALFGLTRAPGPLADRLERLGRSIVDLAADPDQHIDLHCSVQPHSGPPALEDAMLRIAHELIANAVKHGMHMRLLGRIDVDVVAGPGGATLTVSDDGWGCGREPRQGEGLQLASILAAEHGGRVALRRDNDITVATLWLPGQ